MNEDKNIQGGKILSDQSMAISYNVADLSFYIGKEKLSDFNDMKTTPHWNEDLEAVYIDRGHMNVVVNGEKKLAKEGEIVIINSRCIHYFESVDGEDCYYYVGLANESMFSSAAPIKEKYINPIFHAYHPNMDVIRADNEVIEDIHVVFKKIGELLKEKDAAYDIRIVARAHEFLALLWCALRESFFLPSPVESVDADSFRAIINYVQNNYSKKILVSDMAEAGNISRKQCFSLFNKFMGKTPGEFLIEYRLEAGRTMLKNTKMPISDIAAVCGFSHQSHFTNHFKSHFNMTPNAYRRISKGGK